MEAIFTDIHLKENEPEFLGARRERLLVEETDKVCADDRIKRVFFLGDTFDAGSILASARILSFFSEQILAKIVSAGKEVVILVGNHEKTGSADVFSLLPEEVTSGKVKVIRSIKGMDMGDYYGVFVPYMFPAEKGVATIKTLESVISEEVSALVAEGKRLGKKVIVFNHNAMSDLWWHPGTEPNVKFQDFPGVDFAFCGHIHAKADLKSSDGIVRGAYVGSFMRSFTYDQESEGYVLFDASGETIERQDIVIQSHPYIAPEINSIADADKLIESGVVDVIINATVPYEMDAAERHEIRRMLMDAGSFIKDLKNAKGSKTAIAEEHASIKSHIDTDLDPSKILREFMKREGVEKEDWKEYQEALLACSSEDAKRMSNSVGKKLGKALEKEGKASAVAADIAKAVDEFSY